MVKLINSIGVEKVIVDVAQALEENYKRWEEFDRIPRPASHSPEGCVEVMPTGDGKNYAFKYVNNHPANYKQGKQSVIAVGLYADLSTGYPLMLSEMTLLTALRTTAMSALAGKYLARRDSKVMGMVGSGSQAEFQALGFKKLCGIEKLRIYDRDPEAVKKFVENMQGKGFEIEVCESGAEVAIGADILTSCTSDKVRATIISDNMVSEGMHINAIGGDCDGKTELQKEVLYRGDVFVELEEQTREEGEIQQVLHDFPVTELWQVFSGKKQGRKNDSQITIFDSVGFAIEDFTILKYMHEKLEGTDLYEELDILASPARPKDLYGLLQSPKSKTFGDLIGNFLNQFSNKT